MLVAKISPKIYDLLTIEYLKDNFNSNNHGAEIAIDIFPHIREHALDSMKGVFSEEEINRLIDLFRKDKNPRSKPDIVKSKESFIAKIRSLERLSRTDFEEILKKIDGMNFYQIIFLSEFISTIIFVSSKNKKFKVSSYIKRILNSTD